MKKLSLLFLFVLLLSSCGPGALVQPTSTIQPTLTLTPSVTPQPTATSTPTIVPSATLEPGSFIFEIAPDAPSKDVAEIKLGIDLVRAYLRDFLGGDVSIGFKPFTIKIVANGKGNDGSCCTALAESGPLPFFDLKHPNWNIGSSPYWDNADNHINAGAHEYVHAWQSSLGCISLHYQPLGSWLNEGMAQFVSINALRHGGYVTENDYQTLISVALANTSTENLAYLENGASGTLDDIAFIAVIQLVSLAPSGESSLRALCENVASGKSVEQSFAEAFGISKKDFYKLFADYQKTYSPPTPTAIPAGSVAIKGNVILGDPSQRYADYYVTFCTLPLILCAPGTNLTADGSFVAYLIPGDYKMSVNPVRGGDALGWYAANGLLPDLTCADVIHLGDQEISITVDLHPALCANPSPTIAIATQAPLTPQVVPTQGPSIPATGFLILKDNTKKITDFVVTFCGTESNQCLAGIPVLADGTFSVQLPVGKYRIKITSTSGQILGWYTKSGLVTDSVCATIITVDVKHETALTINLQTHDC